MQPNGSIGTAAHRLLRILILPLSGEAVYSGATSSGSGYCGQGVRGDVGDGSGFRSGSAMAASDASTVASTSRGS